MDIHCGSAYPDTVERMTSGWRWESAGMDNRFWCVTTWFNPVGYRARIDNYKIFRERIEKQQVNLLTVELAFPGQDISLSLDSRTLRLRGSSILWQKERLLNYAVSQLPAECDRV